MNGHYPLYLCSNFKSFHWHHLWNHHNVWNLLWRHFSAFVPLFHFTISLTMWTQLKKKQIAKNKFKIYPLYLFLKNYGGNLLTMALLPPPKETSFSQLHPTCLSSFSLLLPLLQFCNKLCITSLSKQGCQESLENLHLCPSTELKWVFLGSLFPNSSLTLRAPSSKILYFHFLNIFSKSQLNFSSVNSYKKIGLK